ncbi:hypothetical protein F8O07_07035 [Pseudoclavibacter sp. CFCC 13796]|uniref:hypothetical protein n=1 Tax=Pseudoclavibacter sp. CFCC 13796 TaxID=2615179 RepID=UPI0013012249|nr:hypothetical protein [Pseudoclavibacter sp. CFCC 13796]KAB1661654.1 hypothetical protein F8O07_07035 [Pseudoclavibacter sp. CFCC 13796]
MDTDPSILAFTVVAFSVIAVILWHATMLFLGGLLILVPLGWFVHANPRIHRLRLVKQHRERQPKAQAPSKPKKPKRPTIIRRRRGASPSAVLRIGDGHPNDQGDA